MPLTKADIVNELFARNLFTKMESALVIDTLFEVMEQSFEKGEDILNSGLRAASNGESEGSGIEGLLKR